MNRLYFALIILIFEFFVNSVSSQTVDSTKNNLTFSGSVGITNNGFSIIPTFSLNSPATIINLAWRKNKFSFEPDIRLVPDASKGGMIWWLRYRMVENKKFTFRLGAHPALTLVHKQIIDNGKTTKITEMLRFAAFEIVPSYQITEKLGISAMYLEGHGLQNHGPQNTKVLFLNTVFTGLTLSKSLNISFFPSVFFLNTDNFRGDYFTLTCVLAHKKLPFSINSTLNQTLKSDVPGNKDFMWNVGVYYSFKKVYKKTN